MSFASLRSARQSKESRSFVKPFPEITEQSPTSPETTQSSSKNKATSLQTPLAPTAVDLQSLHTALPDFLDVRQSSERGRGIYSKSTHKPGTVLLAVKPHAAVLSTPYLDSYCSFCCGPTPSAGLKRCTRCKTVWYCDHKCQSDDWPSHKNECSALQKWASTAPSQDVSIPSDVIRCLGRILWTQCEKGSSDHWSKEINMMQSHRSTLPPSAFQSHTHIAHSLVKYLGVSSPMELEPYGIHNSADLVDIISRVTTNAFTLTSFSLTPIGIAVSPTVALANHSCEPNAVVVFPRSASNPQVQEPLMNVVAIKPIRPSDEILTAYIDVTLPREQRQKALKDTYNFTCECTLCAKTSSADPRATTWCPKSCGGTCPVPTEEDPLTRCVKCKAAVSSTDAVLDAIRIGQEALDKAVSIQYIDPAKAKQLTTNMIPILTAAQLTPSCHPLLAMTRLHQEFLVASLSASLSQELLDDTIRTAGKYSAGLSAILPPGHPVRGVALAELGKLLAVDEPSPFAGVRANGQQFPPSGPARLKLAYETLVHARDELVVGFGGKNEGGMVGKEVRETIVRFETELGVWKSGIKNVLEDANGVSTKK
ncbi:hypothetical protein IEO21_01943 [Rhodonia placenta]|uniref:SET domain-containing protein n=1 Tax=Rhodonia placenta TaxID=104341 RepID=A0A8H7U5C8_9APHY|nr:hypothetical protein IEO21_01943 [Postia placenta]